MKSVFAIFVFSLFLFYGCKKKDLTPIPPLTPKAEPPVFFGLQTEYITNDFITYHTVTKIGKLKRDQSFEILDTLGTNIMTCGFNLYPAFDYNHNIYYLYTAYDSISANWVDKKIYKIDAINGNTIATLPITIPNKGYLVDLQYNLVNDKLYGLIINNIPTLYFYVGEINATTGAITQISSSYNTSYYNARMSINEEQSQATVIYPDNLPLDNRTALMTVDLNTNISQSQYLNVPENFYYDKVFGHYKPSNKLHLACSATSTSSGFITFIIDDDLTAKPVYTETLIGTMEHIVTDHRNKFYGFNAMLCSPDWGYISTPYSTFDITEVDLTRKKQAQFTYKVPTRTMYFALVPLH